MPMGRYEIRYPYKGKMLTLKELAARSTNSLNTIRNRIRLYWSVEDAVDIPTGVKNHRRRKTKSLKCGAVSFYDCFECTHDDCIVKGAVCFEYDPEIIPELIIEGKDRE